MKVSKVERKWDKCVGFARVWTRAREVGLASSPSIFLSKTLNARFRTSWVAQAKKCRTAQLNGINYMRPQLFSLTQPIRCMNACMLNPRPDQGGRWFDARGFQYNIQGYARALRSALKLLRPRGEVSHRPCALSSVEVFCFQGLSSKVC